MREKVLEADGLLARVIQHEVDHLRGVYFFERLSPVKRALSKSKLRRIERGQILPDYEIVTAGKE
jgi:peptide deformylase